MKSLRLHKRKDGGLSMTLEKSIGSATKDMGSQRAKEDRGSSHGQKEKETSKEKGKETSKEKGKECSMGSVTIVGNKVIQQNSAPNQKRNRKNLRLNVTIVARRVTGLPTAGAQKEKEREERGMVFTK